MNFYLKLNKILVNFSDWNIRLTLQGYLYYS